MIVIGLDIGTTGTKALAIDERGTILGRGYREYGLHAGAAGEVTQDAEDWWEAVVAAVRAAISGLDASSVTAMGLSTQGASMLAVDPNGRPLCPAITWMDRRAGREAVLLGERLGEESFYQKSGWALSATLDAAKILWLRRCRPEVFQQAASFVSTLEFVNFRLTGRAVIDPTNAAIRQLMDIRTGRWDGEILETLGITEDRLPSLLPAGEPVGTLTPSAADALGLSPSVRVYNGAHDQYCAALGSGAVHIGDMLLATGTTWVVLGVTEQPLYTLSHISPGVHPAGGYGAMASLVSAGSSLKWFKNLIGSDFAQMDRGAEERMQSAAGLLVYPYLAGAGFPHGKPDARASIVGLELRHDRYDLARAFMEGVAFETRLALEEFSRHGLTVSRLRMTGGAARSRVWSEIVGCVTGCEILRMREPETCCVGAALLASVGAGWWKDYAEGASALVREEPLASPDAGMVDFYQEKAFAYSRHLPLKGGKEGTP